MVVNRPASLDRVFQALANESRRAMLAQLAEGERSIGALAEPLRMTFAGASKHVKVLEAAGLVQRRVEGRQHIVRLDPAALATADAWLRFYRHFWTQQLDSLDALLKQQAAARPRQTRPPQKG